MLPVRIHPCEFLCSQTLSGGERKSNNADITQYKLAPPIAIEFYGKIKANWPALRNTHTSSYLSCCCFFAYWVQENLTESDRCFIQFLGQSRTQSSTLYWGCITESCDHDHMTVAPQIWQFVCSSEVFHCYIWRYSNKILSMKLTLCC